MVIYKYSLSHNQSLVTKFEDDIFLFFSFVLDPVHPRSFIMSLSLFTSALVLLLLILVVFSSTSNLSRYIY